MWEYMERRARACAQYILDTGCTVRACAAHFGVSKSTVHKDVTERLRGVDRASWRAVRQVLDKNLAERHLRGGDATRRKYGRAPAGTGKPPAGTGRPPATAENAGDAAPVTRRPQQTRAQHVVGKAPRA